MTPLPKRKHSSQRQGKRRKAILLTLPNLSPCLNCGELKPTHLVCPKCGFYKGRQVIKIKIKKEKKK
jgi:large subunit ribosomal protein L32